MYCNNIDLVGRLGYDTALFGVWEDAVYEYSRLAFQDAGDPAFALQRMMQKKAPI